MELRDTDGQRITYREIVVTELIRRDGDICQVCKKPIANINDVDTDHIVPLRLKGSNALSNLQLAHRLCHVKKDTKLRRECPSLKPVRKFRDGNDVAHAHALPVWKIEARQKLKDKIVACMEEGMNISQVARTLEISRPTVYDILSRIELK
jgi:hypothetical protein